jgi:DNA-binding NtrC family response regulator
LPKQSGLDLLENAREAGDGAKVILMTAYENRDVKAKAKRLKVDQYFHKPFDLARIIRTVSDLIGDPNNGRR